MNLERSGCGHIEVLLQNFLGGIDGNHEKNLSQDSRCPGRDSCRAPNATPTCSVCRYSLQLRKYEGFEVLTTVVMKISIFWVRTSYSPLKVNQGFGGICRLHLQGRRISQARKQRKAGSKQSSEMETTHSSEASVDFQQTTRRYSPEDRTLHCLGRRFFHPANKYSVWRVSSSGIWRRVVPWVSTNVSKEHIASIFRFKEIGSEKLTSKFAFHLLACWFCWTYFFESEEGGGMFLRNVGLLSTDCTTL
jgi:hypothetical protein